MAIYRTIQMSFWTDPKVIDDFTPEDKFFYLYLMTNPHTNLIGCYEISIKQISDETGYSKETIEKLLERFSEIHKVIGYSKTTKEVFLLNWHKHNWTNSTKLDKPLLSQISEVKNAGFRKLLIEMFNNRNASVDEDRDTLSIPYEYPIDTTVTVTDTVTVTNTVSDKYIDNNKSKYIKEASEDLFETLWMMYPKKRGKGSVSASQKRKLYDVGFDEMARCIDRYKQEVQGKDEKYIKMGSTFFNSGYIDYLDENYVPPRDTSNDAILAFLNAEDD